MKYKLVLVTIWAIFLTTIANSQRSVGVITSIQHETYFHSKNAFLYDGEYDIGTQVGAGVGYFRLYKDSMQSIWSLSINRQSISYNRRYDAGKASYWDNSDHKVTNLAIRCGILYPLKFRNRIKWSLGGGMDFKFTRATESTGEGWHWQLIPAITSSGDTTMIPGVVYWTDIDPDPRQDAFSRWTLGINVLSNLTYSLNELYSIRFTGTYFFGFSGLTNDGANVWSRGMNAELGFFYTFGSKE